MTSRLAQAIEVKIATHISEKDHSVTVGAHQTIPSYIVEQKDIKSIRFRLWGLKTLWSQDVRETRLVKVSKRFHFVYSM